PMKAKLFIFLAIMPLFFAACNLEGGENYTPSIYVFKPYNQNGDSLAISITDASYVLDTITVGDTITLRLYMEGYANNLTAFYLKQSSDLSGKIVLPSQNSMDSTFTAGSDYAAGKFLMAGTSSNLFFPFRYVALNANKESTLTFTIISDAKFDSSLGGSNTSSFTLKTPIKAAATPQ
ncbi:MAG: hypothetical protein H6Q20_2407, partial [Bacteroidetes bacterium]|nr:hypothetical protein [Bacteroidota bacterium]